MTHALDLTLAYEGFAAECERNTRPASLLDAVLRGQTVHVLIRRIELPDESEQALAWLQGVWADKERALKRWENDGHFEAETCELPMPLGPLLAALLGYFAAVAALAAAAVWLSIGVARGV